MISPSGRGHFGPRQRAVLFFFVPGFLYLVIVRIVPALFTIYMSLTRWNLTSGDKMQFIGLANYGSLGADSGFLDSLLRTLVFMIVATTVELILGLGIAVMLNRAFRLRRLIRTLVLAPMVVTPAVVGTIWYILFQPQIGPINDLLSVFGIGPVGWLTNPHVALFSVIIADVWHWTPFLFLLSLAALQAVPVELSEAAAVDGAAPWQIFFRITLPFIRDTLLVAVVLRAMDAFEIFAEPYVMTGGGPGRATETLSLRIYRSAFLYFHMGYTAAMIVISIAILVALYGLYLRLSPQPA